MANPTRRPSLRRRRLVRFGLIAALALALGLAMSAASALSAHAAGHHKTDTAISGLVVNGTHGGAAVPSLAVTLQATDGSGAHDVASATTDAGGRFTFANLANADSSVFAVYARFEQGFYSTGDITVDNGTQGVSLTVYDATNDPSALRITSITALVSDPRPKNGLIRVGEYYTFHNAGNTAFVGTTSLAGTQPMGLLRFSLPSGASDLTLGAGFVGAQMAQVPTGFGASATVPPGDSQFAFAFDAPYTGTTCSLTFKAEYAADHLLLLVPPSYQLTTHDLTARGSLSSSGDQYNAYTRDGLDTGTTLSARVLGLPAAGETPDFTSAQLVALAAALALLLVVLLALYLRRGELASLLRLTTSIPTKQASTSADLTDAVREVEVERLLRRLLALERAAARTRGNSRARQEAAREAGQVRARVRALLAAMPSEELGRMVERSGRSAEADRAPAEAESSITVQPVSAASSPESRASEDTISDDVSKPAEHLEVPRLVSGGGR